MEYFIIDNNGKQAGPYSLDQLAQLAITPETLVWAQGMQDWTPAWKIDELKTTLEAAEAIRASKPQQEEQAVPPATPQQEQPAKKKSNKNLWKIILALIVIILLIFAFTNPGAEAHKDKVRTEVGKAVDKATATSDNNFFTQGIRSIAKMMAGSVIDQAMNQLFEYHNYIVCSKGMVEFDGKQHTVSFGILGNVYTMNADDMVKALEDDDHLQIEENESSSPNPSDVTGSDDATGSNDADSDKAVSNDVEKRLEDKANSAIDRITDKVSKKIEDKINQKIDEATDSSTVEKLVEKVLSLF